MSCGVIEGYRNETDFKLALLEVYGANTQTRHHVLNLTQFLTNYLAYCDKGRV